jgi:hypothetical protein
VLDSIGTDDITRYISSDLPYYISACDSEPCLYWNCTFHTRSFELTAHAGGEMCTSSAPSPLNYGLEESMEVMSGSTCLPRHEYSKVCNKESSPLVAFSFFSRPSF